MRLVQSLDSMNDFNFYRDMSFEELVDDPRFKCWVIDGDESMDMFWSAFLTAHPDRQEIVRDARAFLLSAREYFEASDLDNNTIEDNLKILLGQAPELHLTTTEQADTTAKRKGSHWKWWSIAASVLVVISLGIWLFRPIKSDMMTYRTSFGEWKQVELPDGSLVHLNANSILELESDWSSHATRKVWLSGEAFFEVEEINDGKTKFQVITNDLIIEVLGTQFNVHHRGEQTEVFLKEGKIKLDMEGTAEYMNPGEFVSYSSHVKSILSRKSIPQENYTSWKEGSLQMNATIGEILKEIEAIYGVTVEVSDSNLLVETRNIGVPMKELSTVIPILEISLDRQIIKDENKLIIREQSHQPSLQ